MNVPKLRFKEFNDEWIESNFSKTFSFISNNSLSRNDLNYDNQTNIFNIHYGDILTKMNNIVDVSNFAFPSINTQYLEKYNKKDNFLCNGDIVIADTAEDYTAGKSIELQCIENEKIISGLHTIPLRPIIGFSKNYLGYYLNSSYFHNQLIPLITGIKVMSITKSNLENTYIRYPSKKEQEKIGTFLELLDKKIELQSKKIEALKLYKIYIKNKLFYGNNNVCKLKDILTKWNEKNKNNIICYVESISNKYGFIPQTEQFEDRNVASKNLENYYIIRKNVFAYNPSRLNVGSLALKENDKVSVVSPLYECFTTNQNNKFLLEWFNSKYFRKETLSKFEGGVRNTLNFSNLCEIKINLPDINTQNKDAKILSSFDVKIKYESERLNKLELLKKGLMQNMFV